MLFNSPLFIFYFLPAVVALGIFFARAYTPLTPFLIFSIAASFYFYSFVRLDWLLLLIASLSVNYVIGRYLLSKATEDRSRQVAVAAGISFNILVLGWFKYADFFIGNLNGLFGSNLALLKIALPIGISFHTFQQIAFLTDAYRRDVHYQNLSFLRYCFFISFFPQLVAGPIVHHSEMLRQLDSFRRSDTAENLAVGLVLFLIGLSKKVLLADTFATFATPVFAQVNAGHALTFIDAWSGALSYTLQLYFDFSGYSDMAIGIAKMFGIRFPINFNSPYKATNIVEFWRRWHMTLSRFLRDYLYIPLGGSHKGHTRQTINLLTTMLLGGLWHGAGWGFVTWGALHGTFLTINHRFSAMCQRRGIELTGPIWTSAALILTLVSVVIAWVPFRAASLSAATLMWAAMSVPSLASPAFATLTSAKLLVAGFAIVLLLPNSQQLLEAFFGYRVEMAKPGARETLGEPMTLQPRFPPLLRYASVAFLGLIAALGLALNNRVSEFIYFQF